LISDVLWRNYEYVYSQKEELINLNPKNLFPKGPFKGGGLGEKTKPGFWIGNPKL